MPCVMLEPSGGLSSGCWTKDSSRTAPLDSSRQTTQIPPSREAGAPDDVQETALPRVPRRGPSPLVALSSVWLTTARPATDAVVWLGSLYAWLCTSAQ